MAAGDESPAETAAALIAGRDAAALPALDPAARDALAWALKDQCHAAWSVDPARAVRASEVLAQLAAAAPAGSESHALAHWTAGLAELVQGRAEAALARLDAAAAAFEARGDVQHAPQTQVPKLVALAMLGRHAAAVECAERIRERFIAAGDERSAGKVELNLGSMLLRQDRHVEAGALYHVAATRFARIGDVEHSVMADIGRATTLTWLFDFDEAQHTIERARHRAAAHGFPVLEALARGILGQLELHRGRHAQALKQVQAGVQMLRDMGSPQRRLDGERSLADVYLAVRLLPEALARYEAVAASAQALQAPLEQAWAEWRRAQILAMTGRLDTAAQALAAAQGLFADGNSAVGAALTDLLAAQIALQRQQPEQALGRATAALSVLAEAGIVAWTVEARLAAADAWQALGRSDAAREQLATARAQAAGLPEAAACEVALAALDEADGRIAAARARLQQAAAEFEQTRSALPVEDMRIAFAGDKQACFDALVRLAPHDDGFALMRDMERGRARALADAVQRGAAEALVLPADERSRLNWLHRQWMSALAAGPSGAADAASLRARLAAEEQRWIDQHRAERIAACADPDRERAPAAGPGAPAPASAFHPQALLDALDEHTAFVEYHVQGDRWRACVACHGRIAVVQGEVPRLAARLHDLRFQLEAPRSAPAALQRHQAQLLGRVQQHLAALQRDLFAPLRPFLGSSPKLVIAAHRGLHHVPFAALHDGSEPLLAQHELTGTPSATVWLTQRAPRPIAAGAAALVIGCGGPALPQVEAEVQAIRQALGSRARTLLHQQASVQAFEAEAPQAQLVHLACHAQARADNPAFSALHLADGVFTLADAAALRWQADLVVLSACDTAISRIAPGDEVQGLSRGFLAAGVPAVVASLWSVSDGSTAELMAHFYRGLTQGLLPAAALRRAQQTLAQQQPHPFHWAAFSLVGRG